MEIPLPIFDGSKPNDHPKRFLKNLDTYLVYKKVASEERLLVIENCLRGSAARWFTMIKDIALDEDVF